MHVRTLSLLRLLFAPLLVLIALFAAPMAQAAGGQVLVLRVDGAIGPATADALRAKGIEPDFIPEKFVAEGIVEGMIARCGKSLAGMRLLLLDDVVTTGASVREATRMLLSRGALSVTACALARVW